LFFSFAQNFSGIKKMNTAKVQDKKVIIVEISKFIIFTSFL